MSIVVFRMWLHVVDASAEKSDWFKNYSYILIPVTVGMLNLISIMILNAVRSYAVNSTTSLPIVELVKYIHLFLQIYESIANYLTELELPRTQTEFDNSLSIKLYVFQFVNYYASIMYIAFFKGKFVGYPTHYNKIWGFRQEEVLLLRTISHKFFRLLKVIDPYIFYACSAIPAVALSN